MFNFNFEKNLLRRTLYLLITLSMMVVIAEAFVRLVAGGPASFLYSGSFRDVQQDWDVTYGVNADKRRTPCVTRDHRRRIAVIGDSFVFGQGVQDCMDFLSLINNQSSKLYFENFGVIGIGITEYNMIARDLLDSSFQGALLVFYGNDAQGLSQPRGITGKVADYLSSVALLRKVKRAYLVKKEQGSIAQTKPLNNVLSTIEENKDYAFQIANPKEKDIAIFKKLFSQLIGTIKSKNIEKIYVAVVPTGSVVSKDLRQFIFTNGGHVAAFGKPGRFYHLIEHLSKTSEVTFIDTFGSFLQEGESAYYPHDFHWTATGHQIMAAVVTDYIK